MRISDWSSDVCSSDLGGRGPLPQSRRRFATGFRNTPRRLLPRARPQRGCRSVCHRTSCTDGRGARRSEEHTSELQSLMRISYAVFCLKKKKKHNNDHTYMHTTHEQNIHLCTAKQ